MNVNAGRYLNEHKEKMQISGIYLGALALIYFLYWIFYIDLDIRFGQEHLANFGGFIGGVLSFITIFLLLYSLKLQKKELNAVNEELEKMNNESRLNEYFRAYKDEVKKYEELLNEPVVDYNLFKNLVELKVKEQQNYDERYEQERYFDGGEKENYIVFYDELRSFQTLTCADILYLEKRFPYVKGFESFFKLEVNRRFANPRTVVGQQWKVLETTISNLNKIYTEYEKLSDSDVLNDIYKATILEFAEDLHEYLQSEVLCNVILNLKIE